MPIPNDTENRWWVDVSSVNPDLVNDLRPTLISFLAFDYGQVPGLAGTGFIIAGNKDESALIFTAKHVLTEMVLDIQQPVKSYDPSSPFVPKSLKTPSLEPKKLKALWLGTGNAEMLNINHASYNDSTDIACCVLLKQELSTSPFDPISIPMNTEVPSIGDVIHMVSLAEMEVNETIPPDKITGVGQLLTIKRGVSIRIGVVTHVYPKGFRQYKWPCFTTSIPAMPGMSGGFVYLPDEGKTISACGVVCADNSKVSTYKDYNLCGESVVACTWPALCLHTPKTIPSSPEDPTYTLFDMIREGNLNTPVGGIDHIEMVKLGNGDYTIRNRKG